MVRYSLKYGDWLADNSCHCEKCENPRPSNPYRDDAYWKMVCLVRPSLDVSAFSESHSMWVENMADECSHSDLNKALKRKRLVHKQDETRASKIERLLEIF